jgi:transposase-like protein
VPRQCTICNHTEREAIDSALVSGEAYRSIAKRFATSPEAMWRHKTEHLPAHLSKAKHAEETTQADSLLGQLLSLNRETLAILKEARQGKEKDNELALKAIARAEKQIELQAKLLGELQEGTTVNVFLLPEWQQLRALILSALAPHPQARSAVVHALERIPHVNSLGA